METLKSHLGLLETTDFGFQRWLLGKTSYKDKNVLGSVIDIVKIELKKNVSNMYPIKMFILYFKFCVVL